MNFFIYLQKKNAVSKIYLNYNFTQKAKRNKITFKLKIAAFAIIVCGNGINRSMNHNYCNILFLIIFFKLLLIFLSSCLFF